MGSANLGKRNDQSTRASDIVKRKLYDNGGVAVIPQLSGKLCQIVASGDGAYFQWACGAGLIHGTAAHTLAPQSAATPAQMAAVLMRFDANCSIAAA